LNRQLIQSPRPLFEHFNTVAKEDDLSLEDRQNVLQLCQPIEKFLVLKNPSNDTDVESEASTTDLSNDTSRSSGKDNDHEYDSVEKYYVHPSLLERWGSAMGILAPFIGFKHI
jgi:tRNA (cytosine38-C5)-methyltransferase